jgi:hypothetical protein
MLCPVFGREFIIFFVALSCLSNASSISVRVPFLLALGLAILLRHTSQFVWGASSTFFFVALSCLWDAFSVRPSTGSPGLGLRLGAGESWQLGNVESQGESVKR